MGLCQPYQLLLASEDSKIGPLFVKALSDQSVIPAQEFSFAMNGFDADSSYVDFGAPNYSRAKTNDEVTIGFF